MDKSINRSPEGDLGLPWSWAVPPGLTHSDDWTVSAWLKPRARPSDGSPACTGPGPSLGAPCPEGAGRWPRLHSSHRVCSQIPEARPLEHSASVPSLGPARSRSFTAAPCTHGTRIFPYRLPSITHMSSMKTLKCPPGRIRAELLEAMAAAYHSPDSCGAERGCGEAWTLPTSTLRLRAWYVLMACPGTPRVLLAPADSRTVPVCCTCPLLGQRTSLRVCKGPPGFPAQQLSPRPRGMLHSFPVKLRAPSKTVLGLYPQTCLWYSLQPVYSLYGSFTRPIKWCLSSGTESRPGSV